jgi:hypothetical protein
MVSEEVGMSGAAEGGLGKIMLELGLAGLLAALFLVIAFSRHIWHLLADTAKQSPFHFRLTAGLVALLAANVASFSVATQAFGDIFILIFMGLCLGSILAMPHIIARGARLSSRAGVKMGMRNSYRQSGAMLP